MSPPLLEPRSESARFWLGATPGIILLSLLSLRCGYNDDPRLYYELSGLVLNRPVHVEWLESFRASDPRFPQTSPQQLAASQTPYRDFVFEYPPLVMLFFVLPRLAGDDIVTFYRLFQLQMSLAAIGLAWSSWWLIRRTSGSATTHAGLFGLTWSAFVLIIGPTLIRRFDALPALAVAGAVMAMLGQRGGLAGLLLGTGIALKLWPVVLGPVFLIYLLTMRQAAGAVRFAAASLIVPIMSHLAMLPFSGWDTLDYLSYHGGRGLQLESVGANFLVLWGKVFGRPVRMLPEFGSMHVAADGWGQLVMPVKQTALVAGSIVWLVGTWLGLRRAGADRLARDRCFIASIVAGTAILLLTAKVFSVQFMIWLAPAVLALPGLLGTGFRITYLLALALTVAAFKYLLWYGGQPMWAHAMILLPRNLMLFGIAVLALHATLNLPRHPESDARGPAQT